ncbi:MAG: ribonuclease E/G [Deltaproteobacteria bacterium]|nr:ribonuclease E/G [Deltaproteobacteria bacterium]
MSKKMLINTIDEEESRMAIVEDGQLKEYDIKMLVKEPTTGNIYKGIVKKVERGLRAAFVDYGGKKNGFLPLHDVSTEYIDEKSGKLSVGQEILVKVLREEKGNKGAMLTTYVSLPGRYIVLMPNKISTGISRKIDDESDRKRLKELMEQVIKEDGVGFIVRTAGMNRTKQELTRDYQMLLRLLKDIKRKAARLPAPALIYRESDFAVKAFRDYYTSDIEEILVDDINTYRKMREYCRTVSPRQVKMVKQYRDETPIFDQYAIEDQIKAIYQERVNLKSGAYLVINPTEAMTTIDVNSGRASNRRDVEETAYKTNLEAAKEIARQLRLRDLGGLIVIDFIDMREQKHIAETEKTFKNALSVDRARIQLAKISKFGMLELSRQKKQSTIQEISYARCPHCRGSGMRPSIEYMALNAYRRIKSEAVKAEASSIRIVLPDEVSNYLVNQKRKELNNLESKYEVSIHISGQSDMVWGESQFEIVKKETDISNGMIVAVEPSPSVEEQRPEEKLPLRATERQRRRRPRPYRKKRADQKGTEAQDELQGEASSETGEKWTEELQRSKIVKSVIDKVYGLFKS